MTSSLFYFKRVIELNRGQETYEREQREESTLVLSRPHIDIYYENTR